MAEKDGNGIRKLGKVSFKRGSHCVQPMGNADKVFHVFRWLDIFYPERKDDHPAGDGVGELPDHVGRSVGMR